MSEDTREWYQKKEWRSNRDKIRNSLAKEPLTFQELVDESGLSRATVHNHLKKMGDEIIKKYESGKILIILQPSKIDLVEWFLDQLRVFEISEEHFSIGKKLLHEDLFLCLNDALLAITQGFELVPDYDHFNGTLKQEPSYKDKEEIMGRKLAESIFKFFSPKIEPKKLTKDQRERLQNAFSYESVERERRKRNGFLVWMAQHFFNPYVFHSLLTIYRLERLNEQREKVLPSMFTVLPIIRAKNLQKDVDKVWEWWKDIVTAIPGLFLLDKLIRHYWTGFGAFGICSKVTEDLVSAAAKAQGVSLKEYIDQKL